jgi:hypothetical protein
MEIAGDLGAHLIANLQHPPLLLAQLTLDLLLLAHLVLDP